MIISCPNCETRFRIDDSRVGPQGKKVRCSKCGYVWRVSPNGGSAADDAAKAHAAPAPEDEMTKPAAQTETRQAAEASEAIAVVEASTEQPDEAPVSKEPEPEQADPDGLIGEQGAKLAEARQKGPRSRFWFKVLLIFVIVAGLLLLARNMMPPQDVGMRSPASTPATAAADVGTVEAKMVPNDSSRN